MIPTRGRIIILHEIQAELAWLKTMPRTFRLEWGLYPRVVLFDEGKSNKPTVLRQYQDVFFSSMSHAKPNKTPSTVNGNNIKKIICRDFAELVKHLHTGSELKLTWCLYVIALILAICSDQIGNNKKL